MFLETNCTHGHMLYKSVMEVHDNTSKLDFISLVLCTTCVMTGKRKN